MLKILVIGASGMAGHMVHLYFHEKGHSVYGIASNPNNKIPNILTIDLFDLKKVKELLESVEFDVIVNCAGLLNQVAESNPAKAIYINSFIPHWFANELIHTKTKFIHLSTDCVFSGNSGNYKENDFKDGDTVYDRSKGLGEVVNSKDLTLRQSIIGPEIRNVSIGLLDWFLNQKGEIKGYKNAIWNGITTLELAKGIEAALDFNISELYHLVSPEPISKNDLLNLFKKTFHKNDVTITPFDNKPITNKTLLDTRKNFPYKIKNYEEMLIDLYEWMKNHKEIYGKYHIL